MTKAMFVSQRLDFATKQLCFDFAKRSSLRFYCPAAVVT